MATEDEYLMNINFQRGVVHDDFEGFRQLGTDCDFELRFESTEPFKMRVHKIILRSRNLFFRKYFDTHPKSKSMDCRSIIKFNSPDFQQEFQQELFENLIKYIYTGTLKIPVTAKKMKYLLAVAQKLKMDEVAEDCIRTVDMTMQLTCQNWPRILKCVKGTGITNLFKKIEEWINSNLEEIVSETNIVLLTRMQVLELVKVTERCLKSDCLLLTGITYWVAQDAGKRSKHLSKLVADLDLKNIYRHRPKMLLGSIILNQDQECLKILNPLYKQSAEELMALKETLGDQKPSMTTFNNQDPVENDPAANTINTPINTTLKPDPSPVPTVAVTPTVASSTENHAEVTPGPIPCTSSQADPPNQSIKSPKTLNTPAKNGNENTSNSKKRGSGRSRPEVSTKKPKVGPVSVLDFHVHLSKLPKMDSMKLMYLFRDSRHTYLQVYDFYKRTIVNMYDVANPRKWANLLSLGNSIYYIGGTRNVVGGKSSSEVQVFDPVHYTGKVLPSLNYPAKSAAVCVLREAIYVVGGESSKQTHSCVQKLNLQEIDQEADQEATIGQLFKEMNFLNHPRDSHGVCVLGDKIYAVGGFGKYNRKHDYGYPLKSMEYYNPKINCWENQMQSYLNSARGFCNLVLLNDTMYVIGGMTSEWVENREPEPVDVLKSVEVYNAETKKWTYVAEMNDGRFGACAFSHNGLIYVLGGNLGTPSAEFYSPATNLWTYLSWPTGLPEPQLDGYNFFFSTLVP